MFFSSKEWKKIALLERRGRTEVSWQLVFYVVIVNTSRGRYWWFPGSFQNINQGKFCTCWEPIRQICSEWKRDHVLYTKILKMKKKRGQKLSQNAKTPPHLITWWILRKVLFFIYSIISVPKLHESPRSVVFFHCMVLYWVLIHVKKKKNFVKIIVCNSIFLCTVYFILFCELSPLLFPFFPFCCFFSPSGNVFEKKNPEKKLTCCRTICNLFLSLIL